MPARQSPCNRCNQHVVSPVWFSQRIHLYEASVCLLTVAWCTSWCWWYSGSDQGHQHEAWTVQQSVTFPTATLYFFDTYITGLKRTSQFELGSLLSDQNICACAAYTRPVQVNLGVNWWPSHNDR